MSYRNLLQQLIGLILISWSISACGVFQSAPTATPLPTVTPTPQPTPTPTITPTPEILDYPISAKQDSAKAKKFELSNGDFSWSWSFDIENYSGWAVRMNYLSYSIFCPDGSSYRPQGGSNSLSLIILPYETNSAGNQVYGAPLRGCTLKAAACGEYVDIDKKFCTEEVEMDLPE